MFKQFKICALDQYKLFFTYFYSLDSTIQGFLYYYPYCKDEIITITKLQLTELKDKLKCRLAHIFMSQDELAEKVGTTQSMISRYINGDAMPGLYMFHKIVDAIGCDDRDLLFQDYEKM